MLTLFYYSMSSASRYVRLILNEQNIEINLIENRTWKKIREFRTTDFSKSYPVLLIEGKSMIYGASIISEYLNEKNGKNFLFPSDPIHRAEIRRLCDWFLCRFDSEITRYLVYERIEKWKLPKIKGKSEPDSVIIRMARSNIEPHMQYLNWLITTRDWIGGFEFSYADLAASSTISILDYMGEINWYLYPIIHDWYARIKSRPSFRPLLNDIIHGINPAPHYKDLDF